MSTVLVAEDDAAVRDLVSYVLTDAGFDVVACADGVEALSQARTSTPDLVLLDVAMPGLSGLEVCRELRASQPTARTPIIMLTAHSQWLDVTSGFNAGADDYVIKPFHAAELLQRIDTVLERGVPATG